MMLLGGSGEFQIRGTAYAKDAAQKLKKKKILCLSGSREYVKGTKVWRP